MAENIRIAWEHRRLETHMNVPSVDNNLYVRTLRNRNIQYDVRNGQLDNQNHRGQKYNISPIQNSLQKNCNVKTTDLLTQSQHSRNMPIGNTFGHEYIPIPTSRHERYIR